jgi:hypothetical protein
MTKILTFLLFSMVHMHSQTMHHQSISSQGVSRHLKNGLYVSHTIGQQSSISSFSNPKFSVQQGFQQSNLSINSKSLVATDVQTKMYPNPVDSFLNFEFSKAISMSITIVIYDLLGRQIYSTEKRASGTIMTLDLSMNLLPGNYIIQLRSLNYQYSSKFLKL